MENMLKKFVYSGVGFVSMATERIKDVVDGLVKDGKMSEDEGKKIVDEFVKNSDTKREELESHFTSIVEKVIKSFNFASKKDINKLNDRIAELEKELNIKSTVSDNTNEKEIENEPEAPKTRKSRSKKTIEVVEQ